MNYDKQLNISCHERYQNKFWGGQGVRGCMTDINFHIHSLSSIQQISNWYYCGFTGCFQTSRIGKHCYLVAEGRITTGKDEVCFTLTSELLPLILQQYKIKCYLFGNTLTIILEFTTFIFFFVFVFFLFRYTDKNLEPKTISDSVLTLIMFIHKKEH